MIDMAFGFSEGRPMRMVTAYGSCNSSPVDSGPRQYLPLRVTTGALSPATSTRPLVGRAEKRESDFTRQTAKDAVVHIITNVNLFAGTLLNLYQLWVAAHKD